MSSEIMQFPSGVSEKIGNYVYRLIDPRNGETFYVGKGKGNRVFAHARGEIEAIERGDLQGAQNEDAAVEDAVSLKRTRIRDIAKSGLRVIHVIHRHNIPDAAVFEVEAALIDAYAGLSNIAAGHHSNDRGPMHSHQIIDKYALPELAPPDADRLVLINVNSYDHHNDDQLFERVRYAWRVSRWRVERADYVLAVIHGVVRGVFVPDVWQEANSANFPGYPDAPGRLGFHGCKADDETWKLYVGDRGKRLPEVMRHGQNPVRYWNL